MKSKIKYLTIIVSIMLTGVVMDVLAVSSHNDELWQIGGVLIFGPILWVLVYLFVIESLCGRR